MSNHMGGDVASVPGMRFIPGGTFQMGSNDHYPEEAPARLVKVDGFWMDETPVTNRQFGAFVAATGYVTLAELSPDPAAYPDADAEMLKPGSSLFVRQTAPVPLHDAFRWWTFAFDASWRQPQGPGSSINPSLDHPVVHVAYRDAEAYAAWAGKSLPTEAEWERAARGGLEGKAFAWGDELQPGPVQLANYWSGQFPWQRFGPYQSCSPVKSFPENEFGLYDMIGNVWEWTADWYVERSREPAPRSCCIPKNPRGGTEGDSRDARDPTALFGRKVLKGGSHLCAANYCQRYRPAARFAQTIDTSTSHIGFRCIKRI